MSDTFENIMANQALASANNLAASQQIHDALNQQLPQINNRLQEAEAQFDNWRSTKHVGFSLVDTLLDNKDAFITIPPRFSTLAAANAFEFNAADDYAPVSMDGTKHYADVFLSMPPFKSWFSRPAPSQFTGKKSLYANVSIGSVTHPDPPQINQISLLSNAVGQAHQFLTTTVSEPNYTQPRLLFDDDVNANRSIEGNNWDVVSYNDLMALHENQLAELHVGMSTIRVINLGPYPMHVKGLWLVHHGIQTET